MAYIINSRDIDGGWAWVVLIMSCVQQAIQSMTYSSGLFNIMFLEEFGKDSQTTAWIGSMQVSSLSLYGPLSSLLIHHIGNRWTVILGGVIGFAGFFLSYFATNFVYIFFTFGFMIGLGTGVSYLPWVVVVGNHFRKYRNLAYGIISTSVGFGSMVLPPLIQYLERTFGWRGCMLVMSAIYLNLLPVGVAYGTPKRGKVDEIIVEEAKDGGGSVDKKKIVHNLLTSSMISLASCKSKSMATLGSSSVRTAVTVQTNDRLYSSSPSIYESTNNGPKERPLMHKTIRIKADSDGLRTRSNGDVSAKLTDDLVADRTSERHKILALCNRNVVILALNSFCITGSLYLVFMHFPNAFKLNGASSSELSVIMSALGVSSITCRILVGVASNSEDISAQVLYFSCGTLSGIIILLGPTLSTSFGGQLAFAVLFGLYVNAANSLLPVITLELCSLKNLSAVYGIQLLMCGMSSLVAPPFGGWLYDISGDYSYTFYFAGSLYGVGSMAMMLIPIVQQKPSALRPSQPTQTGEEINLEV